MASVPTVVDFVARYPEFGDIPTEYTYLVEQKLGEAARWTNADVYGSLATAEDATMLKAAILLSESPYARKMNLSAEAGARYEYQLSRMQRAATMGLRIFSF